MIRIAWLALVAVLCGCQQNGPAEVPGPLPVPGDVATFHWHGPAFSYEAAREPDGWRVEEPALRVDRSYAERWDELFADPRSLEVRPERLTGEALGTSASIGGSLTWSSATGATTTWRLGRHEGGATWVGTDESAAHRVAGDWAAAFEHDPHTLRSRDLLTFAPEGVRRVELVRDGLVLERTAAGAWVPSGSLGRAGVDRDRVDVWLQQLMRVIGRDYRPEPLAGEASLVLHVGEQRQEIVLGPLDGDARWVARRDVPGRYLVGPGAAEALGVRSGALRPLRVLDIEPADVASMYLQLNGTGWGFTCAPAEGQPWPECFTITGWVPSGEAPERRALMAFTGLRAEAWDDEVDPDWALGANPDEVPTSERRSRSRCAHRAPRDAVPRAAGVGPGTGPVRPRGRW